MSHRLTKLKELNKYKFAIQFPCGCAYAFVIHCESLFGAACRRGTEHIPTVYTCRYIKYVPYVCCISTKYNHFFVCILFYVRVQRRKNNDFFLSADHLKQRIFIIACARQNFRFWFQCNVVCVCVTRDTFSLSVLWFIVWSPHCNAIQLFSCSPK